MSSLDLNILDQSMKKKPENCGTMEDREEFYTDDLQELLLAITNMVEYTYLAPENCRDPNAPKEPDSDNLEDDVFADDNGAYEGGRT